MRFVACALALVVLGSVAAGARAAEVAAEAAAEVAPETEAGSAAAAPPPAPEHVDEIVVRARRRDEPLLEIPVSVTALTARDLQQANVTRLDDIQTLVPNLQFMNQQNGVSPSIRLRGIGTPAPSIAFDPGVGVYVDGVYVSRSVGSLIDMVDVERVEVLRGPQGTLFGKNTVGGAIAVTTAKPSPDPEAWVMLRPGNLDTVEGRAMLNAPVGAGPFEDRLFARVAYLGRTTDGHVRNTTLGRDLSDRETNAFLGSLRWLPWDNVSVDVTGTWSRERSAGRGFRCVPIRPTPLAPDGLLGGCARAEPFHVQSDVAQRTDVESYGTWGTITWHPGGVGFFDDVELRSITAWREQRPRVRQDLDFTAFPAVVISGIGGGSPLDGAPGFQRQVSEELQVNADLLGDRLHLVTGAFGFWEEATDARVLSITVPLATLDNLNATRIDNADWALFGQATLEVTPWLDLTGGVRYTEERKEMDQVIRSATDPGAPPQLDDGGRAVYDAWTPVASVALHAPDRWLARLPVDRATAYLTYAEGFKGGGFNGEVNPLGTVLSAFRPESIASWEVGLKGEALDGRLGLGLAFFHADYDDLQVTTQRDVGAALPATVTENAARATIEGAELEMIARPLPGLRAQASLGLLDTRYDEYVGISQLDGSRLDRAGEPFPVAPEIQAHASVEYDVPLAPFGNRLDGVLTPRLEWYYQSETFYFGPEVPALVQGGYNLLHARLAYTFDADRMQIALWSRNLTDETYFDNAFSTGSSLGVVGQAYAAPRTFGAEISRRF